MAGMYIYGELYRAQLENKTSAPTAGVKGRMYYDTTETRVKFDNNASYISLLGNDQKCVFGTNGTANSNIRLNRGAAAVLQFVLGGDTTAEGSLSTSLAQISAKIEGYATGSLPASAAGTAGRFLYDTTLNVMKFDNGSSIKRIVTTDETGTNLSITTPTIQKFTSGSGTYTTPAGVKWIRVIMVGGGGGGAGSGTAAGTAATDGAASTFGSALLSAGGGAHGVWQATAGGAGGTSSLGAATGTAQPGGMGGAGSFTSATSHQAGGQGGGTFYGSGPSGGGPDGTTATARAGSAGAANTGRGGGGGSAQPGSSWAGPGGGGGGLVDSIIPAPSASYAYTVGAGGNAGGLGTGGAAGGAGGSGYIIVEEHYV